MLTGIFFVIQLAAQLLTFPVGRFWARFMPRWTIFGASLNPGPFTVKEHVLVTIMATVGSQSACATDIVAVQRVYYNQTYNFGCTFPSKLLMIPETNFSFL